MKMHGSSFGKCLLCLSILVGSATQVGYGQTQTHCTALVDDQCNCSGCSSFRKQKGMLVAPPPCEPGSPIPPGAETPVKPPPSADQPLAGEGGDTVPPVDFPPSFAEQVPFGQPSEDQSPTDPIPLADQPAGGSSAQSAAQFASAFGASSGDAGIPAMLGDFCGLSASPTLFSSPGLDEPPSTTPVAGGDCRHKLAEFTNPCPTDRVFFTYHHYNNGLVDINGNFGDLDLFTVGLERTVWDGLASFEIRVPFLRDRKSVV